MKQSCQIFWQFMKAFKKLQTETVCNLHIKIVVIKSVKFE